MSQEQNKDMSQYFYRASAADFMKIPGSPIGYWVSESFRNVFFKSSRKVGDIASPNQALVTGSTETYIRKWYEPSICSIGFGCSRESAVLSKLKWFPYNKGGDYRNWFGNLEHVVDWENDGERLQTTLHPSGDRVWAHNFVLDSIFTRALVWSKITSAKPCFRYSPDGFLYDDASGVCSFEAGAGELLLGLLCSKVNLYVQKIINPTLNIQPANLRVIPLPNVDVSGATPNVQEIISISKNDWDSFELSWGFASLPILSSENMQVLVREGYEKNRTNWHGITREMQNLEEKNNRLFIDAYGLQDELTADVPLEEITLTCNPHYRYGGNRSEEELETLLQCDTMKELVSYAIGCMMGRYSLDKPGLILASQGETLQDYLRQIPSPRFAPDDDAILPLTDQEWFADDATNRLREFIRVVWGDDTLQENLDFLAESLCLHAIKAKKGESSLDTIRRYLSTQFFKDHLRTYKKRPIYWLFSSGKHKAFECLVYLHRYHEGTLARMRTEYVIPLTAKLSTYAAKLEKDLEASTSTAEKKRIEKELATLHNQQAELATFDETLRHYADQRIRLDLDDGVKVNYGKFGDLLAEVKTVTGDKGE